jgi:ankyrin repeat protein
MCGRIGWLAACWVLVSADAWGDTALIDAIRNRDQAAIRVLAARAEAVRATAADGTTALHWAARLDDVETVRRLLDAGANPDARNRYGVSPLTLAAINGSEPVVDALLRAGADPNAVLPESGETALMTAARTGKVGPLRMLLAKGAAVDARETTFGENALMWAAIENHAGAVALLAEFGADVNARSSATSFVRRRLGQSELPLGSWTPLMYAARQNSAAAAAALLDAGADVNLTDPNGTTPLVLAIINTHYDLAALLLQRGADPNIADSTGMAALYAAVDMHTLGWAHGRAAPPPPDPGERDSVAIVKLLLEHGANPNAVLAGPKLQRHHTAGDSSLGAGTTPLMRAAKTGDVTMMRVLLERGADPTQRQKDQTTLLMIAAGRGWRGGFDTARDSGTEAEAVAAITLCLEIGLDLDAVNDEGQSALHSSLRRGDSVVAFLIQRGANVNLKDKRGRTPLDLAMSFRDRTEGTLTHPAVVDMLRKAGGAASTRP